MKKENVYRTVFYIAGLLILALGLTLNTKAGLGVSSIISVPYTFSQIFDFNFGNATLVFYCIFVFIELTLHFIRRNSNSMNKKNFRLILFMDILQIPLSIVFTRFMNLFSNLFPNFASNSTNPEQFSIQLFILIIAILCTGIGASLSLSMRFIPNPGDGIVQTLADCVNQTVGTTKNCFDLLNISITITVGFLLAGHLTGVGIGTLIAVIGVGRTIAIFQHFTQNKINSLTDLSNI